MLLSNYYTVLDCIDYNGNYLVNKRSEVMALGDGIARNKGRKGYAFQKGYNTAIKEMQDNLIRNSRTEVVDGEICLIVTDKRIKQIAEQMLFH